MASLSRDTESTTGAVSLASDSPGDFLERAPLGHCGRAPGPAEPSPPGQKQTGWAEEPGRAFAGCKNTTEGAEPASAVALHINVWAGCIPPSSLKMSLAERHWQTLGVSVCFLFRTTASHKPCLLERGGGGDQTHRAAHTP